MHKTLKEYTNIQACQIINLTVALSGIKSQQSLQVLKN